MNTAHVETEPSRTEVDQLSGPAVIEFGASWCGWCRAAQPLIASALAAHPDVQHLKVEDGSGRPLGRSFRVRLWPTLIFLRDGHEVTRLIRPANLDDVHQAMRRIDPAG